MTNKNTNYETLISATDQQMQLTLAKINSECTSEETHTNVNLVGVKIAPLTEFVDNMSSEDRELLKADIQMLDFYSMVKLLHGMVSIGGQVYTMINETEYWPTKKLMPLQELAKKYKYFRLYITLIDKLHAEGINQFNYTSNWNTDNLYDASLNNTDFCDDELPEYRAAA